MELADNGAGGTPPPSAGELFGEGGGADPGAPPAPGEGEGGGADPGLNGSGDSAFADQFSPDVADGEKASVRDWVKSKNFKDLNAMALAHWNAEKALHGSGKVTLPGEGASEAEIAAYHKAIGVPDDPKGYELAPIKDEAGNEIPMNTPLLDRLAKVAQKAGVPKAGYEAMVNDFVAAQMEDVAGQDAEQKAEAKAKLKEWGQQQAAKMSAVDAALSALELTKDEAIRMRAALGAGRAMDLFAKLGEGLAEDKLLAGGERKRFGVTGSEAQAQIAEMRKDPITRDKIMVPGTPERERYDRLVKIVGDDDERKAATARLDA